MEKIKHFEHNLQASSSNDGPWGKTYLESVPAFQGTPGFQGAREVKMEKLVKAEDKARMKDLGRIHNCEINMIRNNSDVFGYNIDSKYITWPDRRDRIKKEREAGNDAEAISKKYGANKERVEEAIKEEDSKNELLDDILDKLPDGTRFRITPHAPQSAFSVLNSEPIKNEKGETKWFHIDDGVMEQVKKIKKKAGDSDLTVVMNQIWAKKDENGNEVVTSDIPEDARDYIALCKSFVKQSGYAEEGGKGLVLEIGNECNMGHESDKDNSIFQSEAFAEKVDPEAYTNFYFETAKALKAAFPHIKLSVSGTAYYDYDFTKTVVDKIQEKKKADPSLKGTRLIDGISFHPYRNTVEGPAPFRSNGRELTKAEIMKRAEEYWNSLDTDKQASVEAKMIASLSKKQKALADSLPEDERKKAIMYRAYANFDHQLESLRDIAKSVSNDCKVTVGEVSFYQDDWGDSIDEEEQEKNAIHGREYGYISLLWPGEQIRKYENTEARRRAAEALKKETFANQQIK